MVPMPLVKSNDGWYYSKKINDTETRLIVEGLITVK